MYFVSSLLSIIPRIGVDSSDPEDVRLEKATLVSASLLVISAAAVWGTIYFVYGENLAGLISYSYSAITLLSLILFNSSRSHHFFLLSQCLLGLVIPFVHTVVLGGFWNSSIVIVWSLIAAIGPHLFYERTQAKWWWVAFMIIVITAAYLQPMIQRENNLPQDLIRVMFVMNLGGVSTIILFLLNFIMRQKNEAFRLLRIEEQKAENLLLNILPKEIAAILKNEERTIADSFDGASILFADLVGFTPLTAHMPPVEVVNLLNEIFSHFDSLVEKYGVEKIRTIGDNYMVAAGVPRSCPDHAKRLAAMALDMQDYIQNRFSRTGLPIEFRIGINSGPVIGGVIGRKKFVYDIWGDAVNIASRMESQGVAGKIQVTEATYDMIRDDFIFERRGTIPVKGRGNMGTWFLICSKS